MSLDSTKTISQLFRNNALSTQDTLEVALVCGALRATRIHNPTRVIPTLPTLPFVSLDEEGVIALDGIVDELSTLEILAVSGPMEVRFHAHLMFK
jgi:hypothetical protein